MTEIDFAVLVFIQEHMRCSFLDAVMSALTHLGDGGILAVVIAAALMISKKYRKVGFTLAFAIILCFLFGNLLLKELIARPRPFIQHPDVRLIIPPPSGYSFPSGHSYYSFAIASVLAKRIKKLAPYAFTLAALIAFSRLYLYVHFPTDVIAGVLFGIIVGLVSCAVLKDEKADTSG